LASKGSFQKTINVAPFLHGGRQLRVMLTDSTGKMDLGSSQTYCS
jgi:hypothetical protein